MKQFLVPALCFLSTVAIMAQNPPNPANPPKTGESNITYTLPAAPPVNPPEVLDLKETAFDFGQIAQGKPVFHYFEVSNSGKEPMIISNVQTSCGCTTPEWSKDPVAPGATAKIKVGYNAAAEGHFEKFITIFYNQNLSKQVKISGNVWKGPESSAPSNSSIQLLKQNNKS
jgi:hypothetical protein